MFGSGGNSLAGMALASEVVLAETTTVPHCQIVIMICVVCLCTGRTREMIRVTVLSSRI